MKLAQHFVAWVRKSSHDLIFFGAGVALAAVYLWAWTHGHGTALLLLIFKVALGITGAVTVAMLAVLSATWLMLSKGSRFDEHVRRLGERSAPWAAKKAWRASLIILGFATVALFHADFMATFRFVQAAMWFVALRTFTLTVVHGPAGNSTRTAMAIGYLAGTTLSFSLPHGTIF